MRDSIVDEVRKYRMEHTQKFGGDLSAICADLRSIQCASGHEVIRLTPPKMETTSASSRLQRSDLYLPEAANA